MFKNLGTLKPYFWRYRWGFAFGTLFVLLTNGIWVIFPLLIKRAIDELTAGSHVHDLLIQLPVSLSIRNASDHANAKIIVYALAIASVQLIGVALAKGIFQFLTRWKLIGISREIEFDLRNDMFRHLEGLSYSYYQRTRTGDIMARATNDLNAVRMLLGPAIMYSANTIVFTAAALVFMWSISPKLTLYAFAPLPVASIVVQYFGTRIHERFEKIQEMFSDISARAQENFSGARVLRAYVQEKAEIEAFEGANQEYIRRSLLLVRLMGMLWPTLELLLGLAIVLVLWLGGREVLLRHMTVGDFVAFNTYMVQLTWPIIALGWVLNIFQRGTASMGRINEIFAEKPEITDSLAFHDKTGEAIAGE